MSQGHRGRALTMCNPITLLGLCVASVLVLDQAFAQEYEIVKEGEWGPWSQLSACTVSCGYGTQDRARQWQPGPNDPPSVKPYMNSEKVTCWSKEHQVCPVNGEWTEWWVGGKCSVMCGGGTQLKKRVCMGQAWGGRGCEGPTNKTAECNLKACPPLPVNFDMSQCKNETYFTCTSGQMCVPTEEHCDRSIQCHDGTDEMNCYRGRRGNGDVSVMQHSIPAVICTILTSLMMLSSSVTEYGN